MRHYVVALALVCPRLALAAPEPAPHTPEELAQAKTYYEAGREAFDGAKYTIAIRALEQAYSVVPERASVKFSLGKAYRFQYVVDNDGAKAQRAVALLREYVALVTEGAERQEAVRYLAELAPAVASYEAAHAAAPVAPPPPQRTELMIASRTPNARVTIDHGDPQQIPALAEVTPGKHQVHVEADGFFADDSELEAADGRLVAFEVQLREQPGKLAVAAPRGAAIAVDGKPVGVAPLSPVDIPAGKHFIAVTERGHESYTREVSVARGETVSISAGELRQTGQRRAAYYLAGGAGVLALGGLTATVFALSARSDAEDLAAQRASGNLSPAQLAQQNERVDDFSRDKTLSYGLYVGAAALLATSAFLYFTDTPRVEAPPAVMVAPAPAPGGMTLAVTGRF